MANNTTLIIQLCPMIIKQFYLQRNGIDCEKTPEQLAHSHSLSLSEGAMMPYNTLIHTRRTLMTTVQLYWSDFYELMEKLKMEDDYEQFEELLIKMFEEQFSTKFEIDWLD